VARPVHFFLAQYPGDPTIGHVSVDRNEIGTSLDPKSLSDMHRVPKLNEAIATYEKLIETYGHTREHLIARRKGAVDHVIVEMDERLETNAKTIDALRRAIATTREYIMSIQRGRI
jgi:hypothetical protein